jgi:hypothetical protein
MLDNYKLIIDAQCEFYELLRPWADGEFFDLRYHDIVPGAFYIIGRVQFRQNADIIKHIAESNLAHVVFSNPLEGSYSLRGQCREMGIDDLARSGKILILAGGDADPEYCLLRYDSFMVKILDYITNLQSMNRTPEIYSKVDKPYKFLFLNGRNRPHRKFLLEKFKQQGLLEQALWTNLDSRIVSSRMLSLLDEHKENLLLRPLPIQYLPSKYEIKDYQHRVGTAPIDDQNFLKNHLFNNTWGEIYLNADPYIDTYFSLVTETVFEYPYSFRTEKIWKPIAMGHPWIAATSCGYYRDLHKLGFKTFGFLIDETFDLVENHQDRMQQVARVVSDLCKQNLPEFLAAAQEVSKYNQQHLVYSREQEIKKFPARLQQFLKQHE